MKKRFLLTFLVLLGCSKKVEDQSIEIDKEPKAYADQNIYETIFMNDPVRPRETPILEELPYGYQLPADMEFVPGQFIERENAKPLLVQGFLRDIEPISYKDFLICFPSYNDNKIGVEEEYVLGVTWEEAKKMCECNGKRLPNTIESKYLFYTGKSLQIGGVWLEEWEGKDGNEWFVPDRNSRKKAISFLEGMEKKKIIYLLPDTRKHRIGIWCVKDISIH